MIQVQNIQQTSLNHRAISIWSDSLCQNVVGFTYNNEPKQDTDLG